jgi:hypothetical protein
VLFQFSSFYPKFCNTLVSRRLGFAFSSPVVVVTSWLLAHASIHLLIDTYGWTMLASENGRRPEAGERVRETKRDARFNLNSSTSPLLPNGLAHFPREWEGFLPEWPGKSGWGRPFPGNGYRCVQTRPDSLLAAVFMCRYQGDRRKELNATRNTAWWYCYVRDVSP